MHNMLNIIIITVSKAIQSRLLILSFRYLFFLFCIATHSFSFGFNKIPNFKSAFVHLNIEQKF